MTWAEGITICNVVVIGTAIGLTVFNVKRTRRTSGSNRSTEARHSYTEARGGGEDVGAASGATEGNPGPGAIPLESVTQEEPIRAWRGVQIRADDCTVALGAMNDHFGVFTADEHRATCNHHHQYMGLAFHTSTPPERHDAPGLNCECGFYGVKDKSDAYGQFVAEADFYGTVVEHETGYRAEFQRILSVRVVRGDVCCGAFLCDGKPELVVFPPNEQVPDYRAMGMGGSSGHVPMRSVASPPLIVCAECAPKFDRVATLPQLAGRLGVEFRWADD